ncbi:MAG: CBU_0592 family membrane protein, partial [Gammaproteobacteria bacterium]
MEYSDQATLIGSLGVALLLLAFLLNVFRLLRVEGYPYIVLNLVGASSLLLFVPDRLHAVCSFRGNMGRCSGRRACTVAAVRRLILSRG